MTGTGGAGRLEVRASPPREPAPPSGRVQLGLAAGRDALLHVPPGEPRGLVVLLHGAGSSGAAMLAPVLAAAPEASSLLLAPDSRGPSWDVIHGGFGPDVAFLDRALAWVFSRFAVDPERIAIGGFSDGASYALSLGLTNGELFRRILAFSPGFLAPAETRGRPEVFVTHGVEDRVLPVGRCSRRLVPAFRAAGYDVVYEEFDGGHVLPPELVRAGLAWAAALEEGAR